MYRGFKVVALVPCNGNTRYLRIITEYLRKETIFDEIRIWLTDGKPCDNLDFFESLSNAKDAKFNLVSAPPEHAWTRLFYHNCCDPGTLYLKIDSDVIYVHKDAIKRLLDCRIKYRHPFVISANVVNNGLCSYLHWRNGIFTNPKVQDLHPDAWLWVKKGVNEELWRDATDAEFRTMVYASNNYTIYSPEFAIFIHNKFLYAAENDQVETFFFPDVTLANYEHWSVNTYTFFGHDFAMFNGEHGTIGDEIFFGQIKPRELGRPVEICGNALTVHHAFGLQREGLMKDPTILERYEKLAGIR